MKDNLNICVLGNQHTTTDLIKTLLDSGYVINYLVTLKKNADVINSISNIDVNLDKFCLDNNIKIYYTKSYSFNSTEDIDFFNNNEFDIGISCSWQRIIPQEVLGAFKYGIFGWHGSMFYLPNGRGRSPLNWSIRLGAKSVYHNLFKYDNGADTGKVFETKKIKIKSTDNIKTLLVKVQNHMNMSSIKLLNAICNDKLILKDQVNTQGLVFPKLTESDGEIFLNTMTYKEANNLIRSCTYPFPGAFIYYKNNKIKVWSIKKSYFIKLKPGSILINKNNMYIGFKSGTGKIDITYANLA